MLLSGTSHPVVPHGDGMIQLTVVVGVVIGVIIGLVASGGRGVVSAVVVVTLPKKVGQCLMAGWDLDGIHTWLLVPELVTSYPFPLEPDDWGILIEMD